MPEYELNESDRCDRCGAQAYTRWLMDALRLLMCAHHANHHDLALMAKGWELDVDERHRLDKYRLTEPA
jgi:hypothetical protein